MTTLRHFLTRLIWLCVLPLLLLAVVLAVGHVVDTRNETEAAAERLARNIAATIDQHLAARIAALQILAASPLADDPKQWGDLYRQAQGMRRSIEGHVVFIGSDERMRFHTGAPFGAELPPPPQPAGRSAMRLALASGKPEVGDRYLSPVVDEPMLAIAAPGLRDGGATFVMINAVAARQFERLLAGMTVPPSWSLTLLDSRGDAVALRAAAEPVAARDPQRRFHAALSNAPWAVALDVPRSMQAAPLLQVSMEMLLLVTGATLVALLGAHWAGRQLARSVASLADAAGSDASPRHDIVEIAQARHRLDEAARERAHAEAQAQRAALSLQVREAQLRGIFDSASDAIVTADESQTVVMANPAAARVFGWPLDQLIGVPLERLLPERFRARHRDLVRAFGERELASRPMTVGRDLTALRANGEEFPIEAAISHVHVDGQRLYTVILRDISERRRAERELRASKAALEVSHADLQRLIDAQDSVQEFERKRIARELHDDLQQTLAAIMMDVAAIRAEPTAGLPQQLPAMLSRIESLAGSAIASTRRIVNDLRPQMLEELGLAAALESLAEQFGERSGIACEFEADEAAMAIEPQASPVATCLFRVAQEALNNVAKHAQAEQVTLHLGTDVTGTRLKLTVHDDGKGLAAEDRRKARSFGLMGMAERVRAVGGTLHLDSRPGQGTTVEVEVPVAATAAPPPPATAPVPSPASLSATDAR